MLKEFLTPFENLDIPIAEKSIFKRQFIETKITDSAESAFDFKSISPDAGFVSWIIGSEVNRIPAAMLRAATFSALLKRPDEIMLIDISNNSKQGRTAYRAEFIAQKYPIGHPKHEVVNHAYGLIKANLQQWSSVYETMRKVTKKVTFFKYPNSKIPSKNTLMVCMNPRRGVLFHLNQKLDQPNNASIIADMEMKSIFDIGNRLHFHMNKDRMVVEAYRSILMRTQFITEQRTVMLEESGRLINLNRSVNVKAMSKDLADIHVPIKSVVGRFAKSLMNQPWQDVAQKIALPLSETERATLVRKACQFDRTYSAEVTKFLGNNDQALKVIDLNGYVAKVLDAYKQDRAHVVHAYANEFGLIERGINELSYIEACAERDWTMHHESMDFVFPDYGVSKVSLPDIKKVETQKKVTLSMD